MILKNNSARLITINGKMVSGMRKVAYQVKPGNNPNVDVPDELCQNTFVKVLLELGDLIKVGESVVESTPEPTLYDEMSKEDVKAVAVGMEIDVKSSWTKDKLIEEISKAS